MLSAAARLSGRTDQNPSQRKSIFELFLLVNGAENLAHFWFSKTVFESVFLSGSQIYPLRVLSSFRLASVKPASLKMANTCKTVPLQAGASAVARVRNDAPAADGVDFLTLSSEGCNFG